MAQIYCGNRFVLTVDGKGKNLAFVIIAGRVMKSHFGLEIINSGILGIFSGADR
ncbi:hypothetical protein XBJ2_1450012 [Xenorhabdus bovienii str. Jollieti]|uniref:Uncharacterized protein n=1 Tax=Xenorhabdus bovienii (strain SS-2004) TaxID=406818 RepID=D3V7P7_XENBS|nr:hypothetical protein XBJ1_2735 [Xenorhabdus bovienii SS-2004]CDH27709.1 hypothetical protein XBJ2_1450012 [Xenorhabdus bovienii str. Jollieti]